MTDELKIITPIDLLKEKDKNVDIQSFVNSKRYHKEFQVVPSIQSNIKIKTPY